MLRKNLDLIVVGFIVLALVMYDVTLELLGELMHLMFEGLHVAFEYVELGIEETVELIFHVLDVGEIVEYLFESDRHGSQVVTFYILLSIFGFGFYKLWKTLPRVHAFLKLRLLNIWVRRKTELQLYWLSLTMRNKVTLAITALLVAYIASFFVM
ncbi:hypothetical protein NP603_17370 [Methylomonas sp. SURF-1]|uniref:Uncharacterized protein n=1 Tax=Methylomonas aurea TaxID=2952224 RepID=A0ABT1UM46_9GAMM|nr:hypothetical protein [Methylomonas sp. SURF-1]MCQ8182898.1 hypothetical protein [Methylomonas sp. SURF-1]